MSALATIRRRLSTSPARAPLRCVSCGRPIHSDEQRLRLHGGAAAHTRCATYQLRGPSPTAQRDPAR
jgi:hypothetical protein